MAENLGNSNLDLELDFDLNKLRDPESFLRVSAKASFDILKWR
jgi:hypothetical protein